MNTLSHHSRRHFLKYTSGAVAASAASFISASESRVKAAVTRANGAGSYRLGPFVHAAQPDKQAFMITDFGFDETFAFCTVRDNREPFLFPTATLGTVRIGAHEFFMDMQSTEIHAITAQESPEGNVITLEGKLLSITIIGGQGQEQVFEEVAPFICRSLDAGALNSEQRDFFSMTAIYSAAGGQREIFGERATFEGRFMRGNCKIILS